VSFAADPLPEEIARALPGRFVVFEGPDGSGKSTQLRRFVPACNAAGVECVETREPGGTRIGERIRGVLLEHSDEEMDVRCEMLLYMASRAQLVQRVIRPALAARRFVLADRFVSSTVAYQGVAGGLGMEAIAAVGRVAIAGCEPDLVVIFDVDPDTAASRLSPLLDRMEARGRAFHERVREGYHAQAEADPKRFAIIDASRDEHAIYSDLLKTLAECLTPRDAPAP